MNVLIVYAHPEPTSFNTAMRDAAASTLREEGHGVVVSDLYAMGFHAVLGAEDFRGKRLDSAVLNVAAEQTNAHATGSFAADIAAEQAKVAAADLLMVAATTGTSADTYAPDGIDGDIHIVLWPVHNGLLRYTGFDVLPPHVVYMPGRIGAEGRKAGLEAYRQRLRTLDATPRLFFHSKDDYGPNERLKPGVLARSGIQRNL